MANISSLFLATEKTGGLFDLDGTLILVALQFLVLMVVLDLILYTPLLTTINERNQYINKNLAAASNKIAESNKYIKYIEEELAKARKDRLLEVSKAEKLYKASIENQIKESDKVLEKYVSAMSANVEAYIDEALSSLEGDIQTLINLVTAKVLP
jgi:F-type H+-transporting ATPase subunit b